MQSNFDKELKRHQKACDRINRQRETERQKAEPKTITFYDLFTHKETKNYFL